MHSVLKKLRDPQECGITRAWIGVKNESRLCKEFIFFYSNLYRQHGGKAPHLKLRYFVFRCQEHLS